MLDPMCMSDYNKITGISGCIPDVSEMTKAGLCQYHVRGRQKLYSEINDHPFAVAVQWHPEMMYDSSEQLKLLRAFVEAAGKETES